MHPGLPRWLSGKKSTYQAGSVGLIPGSGRSPGEGYGNPFQYSCLENSRDRGAWQATVHGDAKESDMTWQQQCWIEHYLNGIITFGSCSSGQCPSSCKDPRLMKRCHTLKATDQKRGAEAKAPGLRSLALEGRREAIESAMLFEACRTLGFRPCG
ncbi:unnamed protein product [Rangifer tarandus platyrhynchus]|uniref:Uncharacterized protein n=1 Tax=Rangifer tarandus platyrhynchus TaxID=3082113 RepID=A0ACB1KFD6_RANTA